MQNRLACKHLAQARREMPGSGLRNLFSRDLDFWLVKPGYAQIDWVVSRPMRASPLRTIANFVPIGPMTS